MKSLILTAMVAIALFFSACNSESKSEKNRSTDSTSNKSADSTSVHSASTYTCPMHPEVLSDKPGKCPKCKMDLVAKEGTEDHTGHQH